MHTVQLNSEEQRTAAIRDRNDAVRKLGITMMLTSGVRERDDVGEIARRVREFDLFTPDNDPYGEHDFGSFTTGGQTIIWKIDYYGTDLKKWCDPLSADCRRIVTVMLAEEY